MAKRKNPADLTGRNLLAAKKRESALERRLTAVEQVLDLVVEVVLSYGAVQTAVEAKPKRKRR